MRIVVASDSFKGSLSSDEIVTIVSRAAADLLPDVEVVGIPMADGGEGTARSLVASMGGTILRATVCGPLGSPVAASWGLLSDGTAIIEMAAASGLPLVPESLRDPLGTTTRGTGELVRAALDANASSILLAIGGSATNDGGMGALSALGVSFLDESGAVLVGTGADLARVAHVDTSRLDARLARMPLRVMCDVDNPLLGPDGATETFGPQKGADRQTVLVLEAGMRRYLRVSAAALGSAAHEAALCPGAGAAGGLGFALRAFLGATMAPGIDVVLDHVGFDALIADADLVITGEGRLDAQTAHGKVVSGVAGRAARAGVSCVAIVGSVADGVDRRDLGLASVVATTPEAMSVGEAMRRAGQLYEDTVRRVLASWSPRI